MITRQHLSAVIALLFLTAGLWGQKAPSPPTGESPDPDHKEWSFGIDAYGYLVPDDQSYFSPTFSADRKRLHLEARYNYENYQAGSLWAGYNLHAGQRVALDVTPMFGVVFGSTTGVAPGFEMALTWKRLELSSQGEYVIDTNDKAGNFFYSWNELVYSPTDWFHAGLVAQRTRAYQTPVDVQRGFSVGVAHKDVDFTTYVFNVGWTDPTVVLALSFRF